MDETALFFRALPNKSMIQKSEEARGGKIPKERLTISFCVSAAGEKEALGHLEMSKTQVFQRERFKPSWCVMVREQKSMDDFIYF
ncbi:hypothetical protein AVEN_221375-1 [Araneus ventricosus]|uniref:DDE-1 domain-containing protein n=1 Tax=Araneus ventricosus TaxID=182803 RepID=A0A4Y2KRD8_ARAVE|nr:hypothetical protein AVEN_221375-1 [Araneus ventricosus]